MPTLRQDSTIQEFNFTAPEEIAAKTLTPLQIAWLNTKFAQLTKQKASMLIPQKMNLEDREFICEIAEIDGKMNMIQELFGEHQEAMEALKDPDKVKEVNAIGSGNLDAMSLAQRAANQV